MMKLVKKMLKKAYDGANKRVMGVVSYPYKSMKTRAMAILAMDLGLYAAFLLVMSIPMVGLLGISLLRTIGITAVLWLGMDAIACLGRKLRLRARSFTGAQEAE